MKHVDFYGSEYKKTDNFAKVEVRKNSTGGADILVNGMMLPDVLDCKINPNHPFPRLIVEIAIEELAFDPDVVWRPLKGSHMKAKDIRLIQTCDACPEQYDAVNESGDIVGYIRIRWGYITVLCPDAGSDTKAYSKKLHKGYGSFASQLERKMKLRKAKRAIASWWNEQTLYPQ